MTLNFITIIVLNLILFSGIIVGILGIKNNSLLKGFFGYNKEVHKSIESIKNKDIKTKVKKDLNLFCIKSSVIMIIISVVLAIGSYMIFDIKVSLDVDVVFVLICYMFFRYLVKMRYDKMYS